MKLKVLASACIATLLAFLVITGCATSKAKLLAQAKLSQADAEKIALAKVPGGTVKEADIENEKGKLVWSFDIATPNTKDITEVLVDAMTGEIVAIEKETAGAEEKEKKETK